MNDKKPCITYLSINLIIGFIRNLFLLKYIMKGNNQSYRFGQALHRFIIIGVVCFVAHSMTVAQESDGAVCISETNKEPQENTMLEVESGSKGILIPHMSFETMLNIEPKHDGLTVYVTDDDKKGFYFYKEDEDGEGKWVKLMNSTMGRQDIPSPPGTIIMYVGEVTNELFDGDGTGKNKMQGWQICNGKNESPDLSGRFIVGAKFENPNTFQSNIEESGGENTISIDMSQIYPHSHTFTPIDAKIEPHAHDITRSQHHHTYKAYKGGGSKKDNKIQLVKKKNRSITRKVVSEVKKLTINETPEIQNEIQFDAKETETRGKGIHYENRPDYIVVLYLIKL